MKVHTFVFSITSWCMLSCSSQPAITYLPTSFSAMSQHSFAPPPESSSFGFSGPTGYTVSGFSSPSKYYGSFKKSYSPPKIFAVIPHKYTLPTSGYDVPGIKNFEEFHHAPAHYEFRYKVHDHYHGSEFGHAESRVGNVAKGQYMVLLPDGRRQIVDYVADSHGYRPTIRYEGGHEKIRYGR